MQDNKEAIEFFHGEFLHPFLRVRKGTSFHTESELLASVFTICIAYIHISDNAEKRRMMQNLARLRDGNKCVDCGIISASNIVHAADWYVEHTHLDNQVVLCNRCHDERHTTGVYGYTRNGQPIRTWEKGIVLLGAMIR